MKERIGRLGEEKLDNPVKDRDDQIDLFIRRIASELVMHLDIDEVEKVFEIRRYDPKKKKEISNCPNELEILAHCKEGKFVQVEVNYPKRPYKADRRIPDQLMQEIIAYCEPILYSPPYFRDAMTLLVSDEVIDDALLHNVQLDNSKIELPHGTVYIRSWKGLDTRMKSFDGRGIR